jgi:large subunit ribosomal protein L24e
MEKCSFCGNTIERGTGKTLVRRDGTLLHFCSRKCEKNQIELKRNPIKTPWTLRYRKFKGKLKPEEAAAAMEAGPKKVKKGAMPKFVPDVTAEEKKEEKPVEEPKKEEKPAEAPKEEKPAEKPKEEPKKEEKKEKKPEEKPAEAPKEEKK